MTFLQTAFFVAQFRRLGLNDDDLRELERVLMDNPSAGKVMPRTGGVRKLRFAPQSWGRGKRGALRVCYAWFPESSAVGLFLVYPKNEKDTLSADDEAACRILVGRMNESLKKR